ncbi:MAG TPA: zinc-binding dehydrogenase [Gemmatimonadaceae bacterium]|nr:zinc-binding dehydrogenase [Gemmatimonadaceae bacterium]
MRALTISAHGGLERLEFRDDLSEPQLTRAGDVRVRMRAAGLNHLDLFVLPGLPKVEITPPWVMGGDGAGIVDAVGKDVTHVKPGDRVIINPGISDRTCEYCRAGEQSLCVRYALLGEHLPGTIADYVVVPGANVLAIPETVPWEVAGGFGLATLTAWRMVVTRAAVRAGEEVLIWGIGGGVAVAALQIAKMLGARVWVTSGSDEKLARARTLGADETLNHRTQDVAKEIRARTGKRGVDVVIDNVGEATWQQSLGALGKAGRLVTCGGTSGPMVTTDVRRLFWNQWTIMGSTMGNDAEFAAITEELRRGKLYPPVDSVWDITEGRKAFERLAAAEQFGKVIVRVSDD